MVERSDQHGHQTKVHPRQTRLFVNGVGSDAAICEQQAIIPIAVKYLDQPAIKQTYHANIATGCGKDLPAIIGLDSMKERDSVILLRDGKEMLVFPGPGGYSITWSPGTRLLPLQQSASGHMVIPCDAFGQLSSKPQHDEHRTFWTMDNTKDPETKEVSE